MDISDTELINKYLKGKDNSALEELIKRYLPLVFSLSRRYIGRTDDAADIAQETFVKVWKKIGQFDQSKNFKNWLLAIAKNTAIDWLRKSREIPLSVYQANQEDDNAEDLISNLPDPGPSVLESLFQSDLKYGLELTLGELPPLYREVIKLRYEKELSFKEIAGKLKEPLNTVKSRHWRGLAKLKKFFSKLD